MLFFIIAVLTALMTWLFGTPAALKDEHVSAWADAPVSPQVMDANVRLVFGGDHYLFFPSDNVFVKHGQKTPESPRRVTLNLGEQTKVLMYVPQKRAIRDQQARLATHKEPICPRLPQDVNAAVLWQVDKLGVKLASEMRSGKIPSSKSDPGKPMRSLYEMHLIRKPALTTDAEREAAWKPIKETIIQNIGKPVDVTALLGIDPAKRRLFAKLAPTGQMVSIWTVVPVKHPVYKYRIEVEQDTERTGSAITTAIFASTEDIAPCLDLSERISVHAVRVLAETQSRLKYN